jgi:hypothetical protein
VPTAVTAAPGPCAVAPGEVKEDGVAARAGPVGRDATSGDLPAVIHWRRDPASGGGAGQKAILLPAAVAAKPGSPAAGCWGELLQLDRA